jgi:predicted ATP-grasp superfamily ATP-dependent carboligase
MKVLVFEYVTGGGLRGESLPAGLVREGELMLRALTEDLLAIPEVSVTILRDDRLPALPARSLLTVTPVGQQSELNMLWKNGMAASDAVWPVAPETGGVLEQLCRDVEAFGKDLLNSPAEGVRLAASKLATLTRLARHSLPVVPTIPLAAATLGGPCVIKPDDGVGCEKTHIVRSRQDIPADAGDRCWVVQPLLEGEALSLSALFAKGEARLLACNRQRVERIGSGFGLRGCLVNDIIDADGGWQGLADAIARACPELWGYAGVDLLLTASGPLILEINPRLTTSYAGLRKALGINPAAWMLELQGSGKLPPPLLPAGKAIPISLEEPLEH